MGRKNDVETIDELIDIIRELSKKGPLKRSEISNILTERDLLMQNSKYNKNRGKKNIETIIILPPKEKEFDEKSLDEVEEFFPIINEPDIVRDSSDIESDYEEEKIVKKSKKSRKSREKIECECH
jgi:hypothetical protein